MDKKKKSSDVDFISKEEQFRKLNEQLEAKRDSILKNTEELLENHERFKQMPIKSTITKNQLTTSIQSKGKQGPLLRPQTAPDAKLPLMSSGEDVRSLNGTIEEDGHEDDDIIDDVMFASSKQLSSETQVRILRAKLKATQTEINRRTIELRKKDGSLKSVLIKLKESEEDRERLEKTNHLLENQLDRLKRTTDGLKEENSNLEVELLASNKELGCLKKSEKQKMNMSNNHDVKLNKLQLECNKYKQQLDKLKVEMKDEKEADRRTINELSTSKKLLKKQKLDLNEVINKQMKMIDAYKRQQLNAEAAKIIFTDEELSQIFEWKKQKS